ncbi:MAG: hypothetical protein EPO20_30715 [Betaproteobacteria bacterium]|nr:MAG: hypothetical protein EPO20_30715 [Betaproteobacteria bacterium]
MDGEDENSTLGVSWYLFIALALFALVMAILARQSASNAREIAQLLGILPHRGVTMTLMLLSLAVSAAFAGVAAYPIVWWTGKLKTACLFGATLVLPLAALLYWSPQLVRMLQSLSIL